MHTYLGGSSHRVWELWLSKHAEDCTADYEEPLKVFTTNILLRNIIKSKTTDTKPRKSEEGKYFKLFMHCLISALTALGLMRAAWPCLLEPL